MTPRGAPTPSASAAPASPLALPGGRRVAVQFAAMGTVWGASFLFMKVALEGVSFGQVAWTRLVLGAIALGLIVAARRLPLPKERVVWLHFAVVGVVGSAIPYSLFAWAEQHVTSGVASIYNATTPIMTALLATLAFRVERLGRRQLAGIALGIAGVVVIIGPWRLTPSAEAAASGQPLLELAGQLACLGAALCYGITFGYLRRFLTHRGIPGVVTAFMQIGMGAAAMLVATPFLATGPVALDLPVVLSLVVLGVVGTGLAYLWNMNVLLAWGPTATSTVTYITPVVGVALGILVLGETLHWNEPAGAALVLLGVLLSQGRRRAGRGSATGTAASAPATAAGTGVAPTATRTPPTPG
ncbi:putative amino-acid metabolite efflux pump [Clavibacter michiganensis]|uniref:Putative amino-acid metabolite efflux pump n=2 Tax=Clavibacter michiganensis TaxID=28447 RepID=A0A251Y4H4_9MICO|nr:putative amino-acid metabolite efflux pump [Clavibacter michiganensis]